VSKRFLVFIGAMTTHDCAVISMKACNVNGAGERGNCLIRENDTIKSTS
jgi:hypothetical protein